MSSFLTNQQTFFLGLCHLLFIPTIKHPQLLHVFASLEWFF